MKKIFVTGGSGYIGSVVVRRLLDRGYEVVVFDNLERGHRCNVPNEAKLIVGDLRRESDIRKAMDDECPDAVIHFAAYALVGESMADPMMYFVNNIKGGINLLEAMEKVGCKRIIFSSSCATYGVPPSLPIDEDMSQNPTNPYGYSKLVFEQMAIWMQKQKGFRPTFLRYFNAAGAVPECGLGEDHEPETHIIPNVLKVALGARDRVDVFGNDYPTKDGTCVRDYVHLEDLSSAHILALENDVVGAFNLGTGTGISVTQIVDACRKATGYAIPIEVRPRRPGDPPALFASGDKARRELGWTPNCSNIDRIVNDAWRFNCKFPNGLEK